MFGIKFIKVQPPLTYCNIAAARSSAKDFLQFNFGTPAVIGIAERKGVLVE